MKTMVLLLALLSGVFAYEVNLSDFRPELLEWARELGLKSVPKDTEGLKRYYAEKNESLSSKKVTLGKKLFFDTHLSKDGTLSCASCHDAQEGGDDNRKVATGYKGLKNPFGLNTPTMLNAALSKKLFWDGRSDSLEDQAKGPIQAPFEMAETKEGIEKKLNDSDSYRQMFYDVYRTKTITFEQATNAIAEYEKTQLTRGKFDRFLDGELGVLDDQELRGLFVFMKKGCAQCHTGMGIGGEEMRKFPLRFHRAWAMFGLQETERLMNEYKGFTSGAARDKFMMEFLVKNSKRLEEGFFEYHPLQGEKYEIYKCNTCHADNALKAKLPFPFENTGGFLGKKNEKYFRVPLLRNITKTAPYFHNGSVEKLEDAINIMGIYQLGIEFDKRDIDALAAFLKALEGDVVEYDLEGGF